KLIALKRNIIVFENCFKGIAQSFRHRFTFHIFKVTTNFDTFCPELLKRKIRDSLNRLRNQSLATELRVNPVTNFKFWYIQIDSMQSCTTYKFIGYFIINM